ncbi:nicotinamide-nucleotide amidohydrolase family protein [Mucilaginibacter sp. Bleaf8]|uniref:CinA family protein n=1 Tax=Mucilaginibacter sp. Bleaf8 TaxID=2834430 RepID=UPI001BD1312C|nr:nicotinamide-nucleotide amidohydrolase family protein [Mucilaginibacter sp. Bleaf8]MBS7565276.1 nicotinamide-nucleotide amidohydrolase family protein [Mucilaginibacter sp. Bleaf8]
MPSDIVINCSHALKDKDLTISFAESVTAGKVISEFALIPNCGSVLKGSIVCYDVSVKTSLLGVPQEMLDEFTPESAEVTEKLAEGLKKLIPADIIVAVTGLAAPGGSESDEKPVGTMFVNGLIKDVPFGLRLYFDAEPEQVMLKTIDAIADYLLKHLPQ